MGTGNEDAGFKVLFFRPESGKLSAEAIEQTDNYSLKIDTDKGLYKNFHEDWINFLQATKPIQQQIELSLTDLISLDLE